ncbi:hypothetical protein KSP35_15420 [Aquihabitans sp. G128]|uniref:hypothetical protein n=1 Tax=Aquihabitans sp. G128 TaxID=2849779 RepID=UPI001C248B2E|nr:hypothetical protein [Aquihabitans sp. G128]QXC59761.1 hypothetical protein KSP35_15420 [Aquihabitans sp. G128]
MVVGLLAGGLLLGAVGCGASEGGVRTGGEGSSTTAGPSTTKPPLVPSTPTTEPDDGPLVLPADQVVWQERSGGGFVPYGAVAAEVPQVTIYGDGRVFVASPGDGYVFGQPIPLRTGRVAPAALEAFVREVQGSGLFTEAGTDFGTPNVTDGPTTSATFQGSAAAPLTASAYFLGGDFTDGLSKAQLGRRQAFERLVSEASHLAGDLAAWTPDHVRVVDLTTEGQVPDGAPAAWPGPALDSFLETSGEPGATRACGELTGDAAARAYAAALANGSTTWTADGQVRNLVVAALVPGEEACPDR